MSDTIHSPADDSRYQPIFPGRPGESLDAYLARVNAEFAAAMNPNVAAHLSVQDIANRGSEGRF